MGDDKRLKQHSEWKVKSEKPLEGKICRTWRRQTESGRWQKTISDDSRDSDLRFCGPRCHWPNSVLEGLWRFYFPRHFTLYLHTLVQRFVIVPSHHPSKGHSQLNKSEGSLNTSPGPIPCLKTFLIQHYFPSISPALTSCTTVRLTCLTFVTIISLTLL